jgi:hypothetical protein
MQNKKATTRLSKVRSPVLTQEMILYRINSCADFAMDSILAVKKPKKISSQGAKNR